MVSPSQTPHYLLGKLLFQHLHDHRRILPLWFADQEMHMLRHDHVAHHDESVPLSNLFQDLQKAISSTSRGQQGTALVTREGDEVEALSGRLSPLPKSRAKPRDLASRRDRNNA
jgi:hypothetical protein